MRKIILFLLILFILPVSSFAQKKITVTLFYSFHCKVCHELKEEFLPRIREKYKENVDWQELNTSEDADSLSLLISLGKQFNQEEALIPSAVAGDVFLVGKFEIEKKSGYGDSKSSGRREKPLSIFKNRFNRFF